MIPADPKRSREDVLYAFAVELNPGRDILEQYLRDYPEYGADLVDLSYELSREASENEAPLSPDEHALINNAWQRHVDARGDRP